MPRRSTESPEIARLRAEAEEAEREHKRLSAIADEAVKAAQTAAVSASEARRVYAVAQVESMPPVSLTRMTNFGRSREVVRPAGLSRITTSGQFVVAVVEHGRLEEIRLKAQRGLKDEARGIVPNQSYYLDLSSLPASPASGGEGEEVG